jgi:chromosomal replication initiation ATPase DnaA
MRPGLIQTDNVKKGLFALAELKRRYGQASRRNMLVLEGQTGFGKTTWADWVYTQNPEMEYLEADPDWTASWLMRDVAGVLNLPREHATETNKRQIVGFIKNSFRVLLIDEADRVIRSARLLETVRGLHDAGLPIVLIAEAKAWDKINGKSMRFADRVGQVVEFGPVSADDIEATAWELADLKLPPGLGPFIQQQTSGNFRRAVKVLEELEIVCKANPGEITRGRVDQALKNLKIAEAREEKRALRRAAAGG